MWSRQSDCLSRRYYRKLLIKVKGLTSVFGNRHTGLRTAMQDCNYKEDCIRLHMENDQTMTFIQTDYILDASLLSPLPLYLCTQTSPFHVDKEALNDRIQRRHLCVFTVLFSLYWIIDRIKAERKWGERERERDGCDIKGREKVPRLNQIMGVVVV